MRNEARLGLPMPSTELSSDTVYKSHASWNAERPGTLVVACSDGRLQENLDDFLDGHLGITRYDRLYMPGGPGALVSSGVEFSRSDQFRRECMFLVEAHDIQNVILIFHGAAPGDGPPEATCADYRRLLPRHTPDQIYQQQLKDARDLLHAGFGWNRRVNVQIFRCEVTENGGIQFVPMKADG